MIATASDDETVRTWHATTGSELASLDTFDPVSSLAIDGDRLVIAAGNAVVAAKLAEM